MAGGIMRWILAALVASAANGIPSAPYGCLHTQFNLSASGTDMIGACGDLVMQSRQARGRIVITGPRSFDVHRFEVSAGAPLTWWAASTYETMASGSRLAEADVTTAYSGEKLSVVTAADLPALLSLWDVAGNQAAGYLWLKSPTGTIQTFLPQPTFMENCKQLAPNIRLRWTSSHDSVDFGIEGAIGEQRYLSFGPAAPGVVNRLMAGSDVAVVGFSKGSPFLGDFYITNYEECNFASPVDELRGVCEDSTWAGGDNKLNSLSLSYAHQMGGVTFVRYSRAYHTSDARFDRVITPNSTQSYIWATGAFTMTPSTASGILPRYHGGAESVDFGDVDLILNLTNSSAASNVSNGSIYERAYTWDCPALTVAAPSAGSPAANSTSQSECSGDAGDEFETKFPLSAQLDSNGRVRLFWSLSLKDSTITFGLRVTQEIPQGGYISVGLGKGMTDAACYVGWIDESGAQLVKSYYMDTYEASGIIPSLEPLRDTLVVRNKLGGMSMTFTRDLTPKPIGGAYEMERYKRLMTGTVDETGTPFIWAVGPSWHHVPTEGDIHTDRSPGAVVLNLMSGDAAGKDTGVRTAIVAHAACMCIAWLLVTPLSVLCARYLRGEGMIMGQSMFWLNTHQVLVWIAVLIMIAGLVIVVEDHQGKPHLRSSHGQIGVVPLVLVLVQVALGLYQSKFWNLYVRYAHIFVSLSSLVLVVACFVTGVQELVRQFAIPPETVGRACSALAAWLVTLIGLAFWREIDVKRRNRLEDAELEEEERKEASAEDESVRGPQEAPVIQVDASAPVGDIPITFSPRAASDLPQPTASLHMWWFSAGCLGCIIFIIMALLASNVFTPPPKVVDKCALKATAPSMAPTATTVDAKMVLQKYPQCIAFPLEHVGDGWCDSEKSFNNAACGFDGGDCCIQVKGLYDCKDPGHAQFRMKSPAGPLYPAPRNPRYSAGDRGNSVSDVTWFYNNFYEYGFSKSIAAEANKQAAFLTGKEAGGWPIEIGGLVKNPRTIDLFELLKSFQMEERSYRHRCVEAWAIAAPWVGFPVSQLVDFLEPQAGATHIKFTSFMNTKKSLVQKDGNGYPWPYVEGLTLEEARNELTFLAVGSYQEPLKPQLGAPVRLLVPWKYGFKSIKSISKIELVAAEPLNWWQEINGNEYGWWANVNPKVDHPRWSQASERWLKTSTSGNGKLDTVIFNGYADQVAYLYANMSKAVYDSKLFM